MSYHDEIRELLEADDSPVMGISLPAEMREHAERLLALPEASVEALVQAAQHGIVAVETALAVNQFGPSPLGGQTENFGPDE